MNFSIYSIACIKRDFLTLSTINSNSFDINSKDQIDLSSRNNHNQTALDLAKKYASVPLVEHLEKFSNFISLNYDLALKSINHLKICNKIKI